MAFDESIFHRRQICLLVIVFIFVICAVSAAIAVYAIYGIEEDEYMGKKNILFIVVDDLRPALGCYGDRIAVTPNIDQLASKSIVFMNAYAQQSLSGPSRLSFLTSRRPDSLHFYSPDHHWHDIVANFTTLPRHFKNHGYETISVGKIFRDDEYLQSWTENPFHPFTLQYESKPVCPSPDDLLHLNLFCPVDIDHQPDRTLPDIENTEYAIEFLMNKSKFKNLELPFFLAVGYYKPHVPFRFPKEFLELYPIESMYFPSNMSDNSHPPIAHNQWADIQSYDDVKEIMKGDNALSEDFQALVRQGYYASLSYIDDQIGKLLQALEKSGYAEHTTIVLLSDHGFSLGEHGEWSKFSNFDVAVHVPLMMHIPEMMETKHKSFQYKSVLDFVNKTARDIFQPRLLTQDLVELVDLFPTLAEISNLPIPPLCRVFSSHFCSEGLSVLPIIEHLLSNSTDDIPWKTGAFSQYPRPSSGNVDQPKKEDIKYMGYTVRTNNFRFTHWVELNTTTLRPKWPEEDICFCEHDCHEDELKPQDYLCQFYEFYDHRSDPLEAKNLCHDCEYRNLIKELSNRIQRGWRYEMPRGLFDEISLTYI